MPEGSETNVKPVALEADHVIVAAFMTSSPLEPGVDTLPLLVTGPLQ